MFIFVKSKLTPFYVVSTCFNFKLLFLISYIKSARALFPVVLCETFDNVDGFERIGGGGGGGGKLFILVSRKDS